MLLNDCRGVGGTWRTLNVFVVFCKCAQPLACMEDRRALGGLAQKFLQNGDQGVANRMEKEGGKQGMTKNICIFCSNDQSFPIFHFEEKKRGCRPAVPVLCLTTCLMRPCIIGADGTW